jgi:hypothetical protein
MARLEMDTDSTARPDQIIKGLLDFTDRRPDVWPGLKREEYKVFEVGDTWAEIREGTSKSIWARERYDWSTPGRVTWTSEESNFQAPGSYVSVEVSQKPDGGSRLHVDWSRQPTTLMGRVIVALMWLVRGAPLKAYYRRALDKLADATPR